MKVLPRLSKQLISLIAAVAVMFTLIGTAFAVPLTQGDGNAYFYFTAGGLDTEKTKSGFSVNGNDVNYITSGIAARTERIDKSQLIPNAVNTITIYTGNEDGIVDETLSRSEAGNGLDEFGVTTGNLSLILPNGLIVTPSQLVVYTPKDTTTPLEQAYNATVYTGTGSVSMGDSDLTFAYKLEIRFDLTDVDWNPDNDIASQIPAIKNVSLEIGAVPSSKNIVWYSTSANDGVVQLALKSAMTGDAFPTDSATTFTATAQESGLTGYKSYKATMTGLAENTEYVYRVGNDTDGYSDIYSFKTQEFDGDFSFLAVSDPQLGQGNRFTDIQGEIDGWATTLNKAKTSFFNDAAFLACMGDQIANAQIDGQYDAFFLPDALKSFSLAVVPGNHDVGANYTPHYNMPNLSALGVSATMGAGSGDYYFTYGDALFITINVMSSKHDEHIKFLEETVEAHPNAKWKFVMMHYAIYGSTAQGDSTPQIVAHKEALAPVFSRLGIDVVFQGHEHCYARSYMMNSYTPNTATGENGVTQPDPSEVLYLTLNSASGSDYVTTESANLKHLAKRVQERRPNFSKVDVTDTTFTITSYFSDDTAAVDDDDLVDTFTITRDTTTPTVKSVHVSPKDATVEYGSSQTFTATAFGYNNPSQKVNWSISGNESANTTISADGVLSVDINEPAEKLIITATAAEDDSKYAQVTVTLAEGSISSSLNVGQGVKYKLPETIGDVAVTWSNSAGETVTYADTENVGYRLYTGTLTDNTTVTYRVNVGEYTKVMEDTFEDYAEEDYAVEITEPIDGGTFKKSAYADSINNAQKLVQDETLTTDKTVASFGPHTSYLQGFVWTPGEGNKAIGEAFKVSYKLRVNSFDLDTAGVGTSSENVNYFFTNNFSNTNGIQLRAYVTEENGVRSIGNTQLYCIGTTSKTSVGAVIDDYIEWTDPDSNNVISMKDYFTVEIEGNDVQYSVKVNGNLIADSVPFKGSISTTGVDIRWAKRNSDGVTTVTYADDMVYSKAIYVTDTLRKVPVTATLNQGDTAAQTSTVALNMNNGTTKNFTVNYTADTSIAGVKTTVGTIEGFDGTVPVTYTVKGCTVDSIVTDESGVTQVLLKNDIAIEDAATLFVAVYDAETRAIKRACSVALTDAQRGAGTQTVTLPSALTAEAGDLVKAFVWNGKLMPLALSLENTVTQN